MEAAAAWFAEQLDGIEGARGARLSRRSAAITEATRASFGFGFAPDSRGKLKARSSEFGNEKLVEAGLLIAPEDGQGAL